MSAVKSRLRSLVPYIPFSSIRKLASEAPVRLERFETHQGSVLFIDIAGFTKLSSSLSEDGGRGIETLQEIISRYYSVLIDLLREYGGIVYQFAGDSVIVGMEREAEETLEQANLRAARCALRIHEETVEFSDIEVGQEHYSLWTKVGLGHGEYYTVLLGDREFGINNVIVGPAAEEAVNGESFAQGGQTLVHGSVWDALPEGKFGESVNGSYYSLQSLPEGNEKYSFDYNLPEGVSQENLLKRCSFFVHKSLIHRITSGHRGFKGEYRELTCLMLRFDGAGYSSNAESKTKELNEFYKLVQREAENFGGSFTQADLTDKGNVFMILFGAPNALENKEKAAVRLALKLLKAGAEFEFIQRIQAGITTGPAYCGDMGAPFRKSYTVLSENVNLAARLATYGEQDCVLTESRTNGRLPADFAREMVEGVVLKGIDAPITLYRVESENRAVNREIKLSSDRLIGRQKEYEFLHNCLEESLAGSGRTCAVIGEAGIGKSRLTTALLEEMSGKDINLFIGHCYSYEKFTPFFSWKEPLIQYFGLISSESLESKLEKIKKGILPLDDFPEDWAYALGILLGLGVEEKRLTRKLEPREKNLKLSQLIYSLFAERAKGAPICLYFEDLHWADEITVKLLEYMATRIQKLPVLILLVLRPDELIQEFKDIPGFSGLELSHLEQDSAREFLNYKMRLGAPNAELETKIYSISTGNPFFMECIVESLLEKGHLVDEAGGTRKLVTRIESIQIPHSLTDVILSRIDMLDETAKVTLKTAAVIGRIFPIDTLDILLPATFQPGDANHALTELGSLELARLESSAPLEYIFKHILIRDVAYDTTLLSTREYLHLKLADYLEETHKENLRDSADILAIHFDKGKKPEKALTYSLMAADKAEKNYANRDAVYHLVQSVRIIKESLPDKQDELKTAKLTLAEVYSRLGEFEKAIGLYKECLSGARGLKRSEILMGMGAVHQERGEKDKALKSMELALKLVGGRTPSTKVTTILSILTQFIIRFLFTVGAGLLPRAAESKRKIFRFRLRALSTLAKLYFLMDVEKFAWSCIYNINLAERLKEPAELAVAGGAYGTLMNGMGFAGSARVNLDKGLKMAEKSGQPQIKALLLQLQGVRFLFSSNPMDGAPFLEDSIALYRKVGGVWEHLTSLGALGQIYFLASRFKESEQCYLELGALATDLESRTHQAWMYCKATFCAYLSGSQDLEQVRADLREGIRISGETEDLMNLSINLAHLAVIEMREGRVREAAELAFEIFEVNNRYKVDVPHVKISLVDAADAALMALEEEVMPEKKAELLKLAKVCVKRSVSLGKNFSYIKGPSIRVQARLFHYLKNVKKSHEYYLKSLEILDQSPHQWERGVAYMEAAKTFPGRRDEYLGIAREIFEKNEIHSELRYLSTLD